MSNVAVRVEGLGKQYRIGGQQERYKTLRDSLVDAFASPFKRAGSLLRGQAYGAAGLEEEIWALKDLSFEVPHGEVMGIIGRNGAGKSTLLKVLSRITEPTEGYADILGRVGALLEVGTGFHPELTGRENVYLNGAILGMTRQEIDRRFDEIVAFSEVEKYIDTPIKHYSSGMGLRLGFAVAAHLEPEILIVDEVLAVGDASFQRKCLGRMHQVGQSGRTVLFVSHNMTAVKQLCNSCIWLEQGRIVQIGETNEVVSKYIGQQMSIVERDELQATIKNLPADEHLTLLDVEITSNASVSGVFDAAIPLTASLTYQVHKPSPALRVGFDFHAIDGTLLFRSYDDDMQVIDRKAGVFTSTATIPPGILNNGHYYLDIAISINQVKWITWHDVRVYFEIINAGGGKLQYPGMPSQGYLFMDLDWQVSSAD